MRGPTASAPQALGWKGGCDGSCIENRERSRRVCIHSRIDLLASSSSQHRGRARDGGLYRHVYADSLPPARHQPGAQGRIVARLSAPGRIRTCDPRLRRPVLYPTELRAHWREKIVQELPRPGGPASGQRDGTAPGLERHLELQEPAALTLGDDRLRDPSD